MEQEEKKNRAQKPDQMDIIIPVYGTSETKVPVKYFSPLLEQKARYLLYVSAHPLTEAPAGFTGIPNNIQAKQLLWKYEQCINSL